MRTIYQTGALFLFLVCVITTARAQDTVRQTGNNSQSKKAAMKVVLIDRFVVPSTSKTQFLERMKVNRDFIKTLPGFVEDSAYEQAGENRSNYVTIAVWQDEESIQKAKQAVTREYQDEGFNMPEFIRKLNITLERGVYQKLEE